jgi:hypothetical protein
MEVGDMVSWTHIQDRGSSIVLRSWEGKIVEITGEVAVVKRLKSGRRYTLPLNRLRPADQRNELTEHFLGKREG